MNERGACPSLEDRSVGLAKMPARRALDPQRFEDVSWNPGELRAGVDEDVHEATHLTRPRRVLKLDVDSKRTHFVGHTSSFEFAETYRFPRGGVNRFRWALNCWP